MSTKNYQIAPPPKDSGPEPLFRIVYAIDVNASNARKAAETARQMMRAKDALAPVLVVLDSNGKPTQFDLELISEFNKVTTGFVVQKYRKDRSKRVRCIHQEFIAGDDVQFEDTQGEPIEATEHEYQPFNMTLLSKNEIAERLREVLAGIDVGGEQSRQFAEEITKLKTILKEVSK